MNNIDKSQEKFINTLSSLRRKKKISQTKMNLAQKVVSRIENHETDPRLSTIINYLESIDYDINDIFKEESIMKRPSRMMIEHLNLKLKEEGSCLRYVEVLEDCNIFTYELRVIDKYIDYSKYNMNLNIHKDFESMVRDFFKSYGIENTGFSNTVATISAID